MTRKPYKPGIRRYYYCQHEPCGKPIPSDRAPQAKFCSPRCRKLEANIRANYARRKTNRQRLGSSAQVTIRVLSEVEEDLGYVSVKNNVSMSEIFRFAVHKFLETIENDYSSRELRQWAAKSRSEQRESRRTGMNIPKQNQANDLVTISSLKKFLEDLSTQNSNVSYSLMATDAISTDPTSESPLRVQAIIHQLPGAQK